MASRRPPRVTCCCRSGTWISSRATSRPLRTLRARWVASCASRPVCSQDEALRPFEPEPDAMLAKGLRNPWRLHHDAPADRLWIGDVGQESWEEVNVVDDVSGRTELTNFGWPAFEGPARFRDDVSIIGESLVDPVHAYDTRRRRPVHRFRQAVSTGVASWTNLSAPSCSATSAPGPCKPSGWPRAGSSVRSPWWSSRTASRRSRQDADGEYFVLTASETCTDWIPPTGRWSRRPVVERSEGERRDVAARPRFHPMPTPSECRLVQSLQSLSDFCGNEPRDRQRLDSPSCTSTSMRRSRTRPTIVERSSRSCVTRSGSRSA